MCRFSIAANRSSFWAPFLSYCTARDLYDHMIISDHFCIIFGIPVPISIVLCSCLHLQMCRLDEYFYYHLFALGPNSPFSAFLDIPMPAICVLVSCLQPEVFEQLFWALTSRLSLYSCMIISDHIAFWALRTSYGDFPVLFSPCLRVVGRGVETARHVCSGACVCVCVIGCVFLLSSCREWTSIFTILWCL